jgi:hypothetical protein
MIETLFLVVLIVALAMGNAFLSLTSPKRLAKMSNGTNQRTQNQPLLPADESGLSFEERAERERVNYLSRRIERLEQLLLKLNKSDFLAQKINSTNLSQKLEELEEFKQNTRLEIAALKQRLDKISPEPEKKQNNVPEISDEKLREIVFRASN